MAGLFKWTTLKLTNVLFGLWILVSLLTKATWCMERGIKIRASVAEALCDGLIHYLGLGQKGSVSHYAPPRDEGLRGGFSKLSCDRLDVNCQKFDFAPPNDGKQATRWSARTCQSLRNGRPPLRKGAGSFWKITSSSSAGAEGGSSNVYNLCYGRLCDSWRCHVEKNLTSPWPKIRRSIVAKEKGRVDDVMDVGADGPRELVDDAHNWHKCRPKDICSTCSWKCYRKVKWYIMCNTADNPLCDVGNFYPEKFCDPNIPTTRRPKPIGGFKCYNCHAIEQGSKELYCLDGPEYTSVEVCKGKNKACEIESRIGYDGRELRRHCVDYEGPEGCWNITVSPFMNHVRCVCRSSLCNSCINGGDEWLNSWEGPELPIKKLPPQVPDKIDVETTTFDISRNWDGDRTIYSEGPAALGRVTTFSLQHHQYMHVQEPELSWPRALYACASHGMQLASVLSDQELYHLNSLIYGSLKPEDLNYVWIGGHAFQGNETLFDIKPLQLDRLVGLPGLSRKRRETEQMLQNRQCSVLVNIDEKSMTDRKIGMADCSQLKTFICKSYSNNPPPPPPPSNPNPAVHIPLNRWAGRSLTLKAETDHPPECK